MADSENQKPEDRVASPNAESPQGKDKKPKGGGDPAFRAATHSTDEAPPGQHPGRAYDAREAIREKPNK